MEKEFLNKEKKALTMNQYITALSRSEVRKRLIPQELSAGWPSISMKRGELCITIPYFGTKKQDGELGIQLYPLAYTLTASWKAGKIINYNCLIYDKDYKDIDFNQSCGMFKHEAIKRYTKDQYVRERNKLFAFYDELLECLVNQRDFEKHSEMKQLFSKLMEPGQYPMYQKLAPRFFHNYCGDL